MRLGLFFVVVVRVYFGPEVSDFVPTLCTPVRCALSVFEWAARVMVRVGVSGVV